MQFWSSGSHAHQFQLLTWNVIRRQLVRPTGRPAGALKWHDTRVGKHGNFKFDTHTHTQTRLTTTVSSSPTPVSDNYVLPTLEHSLSVGRAAVLETGPLPPQDHKSGTVCRPISDYVGCHIRPVQAVTGDTWGHGAVWTVLTAPNRNILTYLHDVTICVSVLTKIKVPQVEIKKKTATTYTVSQKICGPEL